MKRKGKLVAPTNNDRSLHLSFFGLPSLITAILMVLWIFFLIVVFYSARNHQLKIMYWEALFNLLLHSPAIFGVGLGWDFLLVTAMWFLFACVGSIIIRRLGLTGMSRLEYLLISGGLGAGAVSLTILILGVAGFLNPLLLRGMFCVGVAAGIGITFWNLHCRGQGNRNVCGDMPAASSKERLGVLQGAAFGLLILAAVMNVLATAGPEIFYDALVYHLALPRLYLLRGCITPTPENLYSGIPFGLEMLYSLALALANEHLAALLHCTFGIATALAIWAFMRRWATSAAGILAALFYYLSPLVLYGSWQCGIDMGAGFYLMLALIAFSFGLQAREESGSRAWPIAVGILLGFAMGVKYTLLPMAAVFVFVYFWMRRCIAASTVRREAVWMTVLAAAVFMPWFIKNALFYGNPFYPFLHNLMGWTTPGDWKGFLIDTRSHSLMQIFGSLSGWKEFLAQPWTISMGRRTLDDWPGLSYLLFVPWALCLRWGVFRKEDSIPHAWTAIVLLSTAGYLVWSLTSGILRFMIMVLPFISCLAALSMDREAIPNWLRRFGWVIVILSSLFNLQTTFKMGQDYYSGRWSQLLGNSTRSDYLKTPHMGYSIPNYSAMEYINQRLPLNAKVLFLGDPMAFYCERDFIAATVFDHNPFWMAASDAKKAEDILGSLQNLGVTHLFVNAFALGVYASHPTVMPRDIIAGKVFSDFWNLYMEPVFEDFNQDAEGRMTGWLVIYRLRDKPNESPKTFPENPPLVVLKDLLRQGR